MLRNRLLIHYSAAAMILEHILQELQGEHVEIEPLIKLVLVVATAAKGLGWVADAAAGIVKTAKTYKRQKNN